MDTGERHAILWDDATGLQSLGDLPGGREFSRALDINDVGQVVGVGTVDGEVGHGFVWNSNDGMFDLNDLIDPADPLFGSLEIVEATGINESGEIVGSAIIGADEFGPIQHAIRLTPMDDIESIPEEQTGVKHFSFPLQTVDGIPVFLNTEAGGNAFLLPRDTPPCDPTTEDSRCFNANHASDAAYYSLDLDINGGQADVLAAASGTIVHIENGVPNQELPVVIIDHGDGYYTEYREFKLSPDLARCAPIEICETSDLVVTSESVLGTLEPSVAEPNEHLHFQVKYAPDGEFLGQNKSTENITELQGVTVGGRLFKDYRLHYDEDGTPRQGDIYGRENALLPTTDDPDSEAFEFNIVIGSVGRGKSLPIFIDPVVAIGYDYEIVSGPSFASVILPDIGDGLFEMFLFDDFLNEFVFEEILAANTPFLFEPSGVDRFRILGIETSTALDPSDPTAFVTGLTFTELGTVDLTQTAIGKSVGVSEPGLLALFGISVLFSIMLRLRDTSRVKITRFS